MSGFGGGLPPIDILLRSLHMAEKAIGFRENIEALIAAMALHEVHPVIEKVHSPAD